MSTFWDGTGGALLGVAGSGLIAVVAIVRTRRDERNLLREQMSLDAAYELLGYANEVRQRVDRHILVPGLMPTVDWDLVRAFAADAESIGERFHAYRAVIRPSRIAIQLNSLWDDFVSAPDLLEIAILPKDWGQLDSVMRGLGQGLTNLIDDLNGYLRADLDRQEWARHAFWRRYTLRWRWLPVRRRPVSELVERDERGLPAGRY